MSELLTAQRRYHDRAYEYIDKGINAEQTSTSQAINWYKKGIQETKEALNLKQFFTTEEW